MNKSNWKCSTKIWDNSIFTYIPPWEWTSRYHMTKCQQRLRLTGKSDVRWADVSHRSFVVGHFMQHLCSTTKMISFIVTFTQHDQSYLQSFVKHFPTPFGLTKPDRNRSTHIYLIRFHPDSMVLEGRSKAPKRFVLTTDHLGSIFFADGESSPMNEWW